MNDENYLVWLDDNWYYMFGKVLSVEEAKEKGFKTRTLPII